MKYQKLLNNKYKKQKKVLIKEKWKRGIICEKYNKLIGFNKIIQKINTKEKVLSFKNIKNKKYKKTR